MKKSTWFLLVVVIVGALALVACGGGGGGGEVKRQDPPAEYANMTNPVAGNADAIAAGKDLYAQNCASCHGDTGAGDGPAAAALDPKPRNLQDTAANATDAYIHWVVTEGGAAAGLSSSMPAFKGVLSEDQTWQVTSYIKSLK